MPNTQFGRIPLIIAEIDQMQCTRTYGVAPCLAAVGTTGSYKCFNTRITCQYRSAYNEDYITLRFAQSHADIPMDTYIIPSLKGSTTSPTRINVGGREGQDGPLGKRGTLTLTFIDHPHSDNVVDKYVDEREYDPLTRSTFWAKWLARNLYYKTWPVRVLEGYVGQALADMQTRHYIIDSIEGPDSKGTVTLKAVDYLRLTDEDKAQAPALSNGALLADIDDVATELTVTGGTYEEYTQYATNVIRISDELIAYTAVTELTSGDLYFTGLTRGYDGTEADDHETDDTVQACWQITGVEPWALAKDLMIDYAGVPSAVIPYTDWQAEASRWLGGMTVTRLLTEPIGVDEMLAQLCEQCSFFLWWDEIEKEMRFRAVHPAEGSVTVISERFNILQNSAKISVKPELRASEVWVSYLLKSAIGDTESRESYKQTLALLSTDNYYNERQVYEVYSPWLDNNSQVQLLSYRLLKRYKHPPKYLKFNLDPKDRGLQVGEPFDVEYSGFVDPTGAVARVRYQVISMHESPPGEKIAVEAQKFDYEVDFRTSYWMIDTAPTYALASEVERENGGWYADDDGRLPNGDGGYVWS